MQFHHLFTGPLLFDDHYSLVLVIMGHQFESNNYPAVCKNIEIISQGIKIFSLSLVTGTMVTMSGPRPGLTCLYTLLCLCLDRRHKIKLQRTPIRQVTGGECFMGIIQFWTSGPSFKMSHLLICGNILEDFGTKTNTLAHFSFFSSFFIFFQLIVLNFGNIKLQVFTVS